MTTILIHTRSEHPDMQANKVNAKYHLHVQHSTNATTQGNCIKDTKSKKRHKSDVLKENAWHLTTSTRLQIMGTHYNIEYKLKYINQSIKTKSMSLNQVFNQGI